MYKIFLLIGLLNLSVEAYSQKERKWKWNKDQYWYQAPATTITWKPQWKPYPYYPNQTYSWQVPTYSDWRWAPRAHVSVQPWAWHHRLQYRYPESVRGRENWIQSGGLNLGQADSSSVFDNDQALQDKYRQMQKEFYQATKGDIQLDRRNEKAKAIWD